MTGLLVAGVLAVLALVVQRQRVLRRRLDRLERPQRPVRPLPQDRPLTLHPVRLPVSGDRTNRRRAGG